MRRRCVPSSATSRFRQRGEIIDRHRLRAFTSSSSSRQRLCSVSAQGWPFRLSQLGEWPLPIASARPAGSPAAHRVVRVCRTPCSPCLDADRVDQLGVGHRHWSVMGSPWLSSHGRSCRDGRPARRTDPRARHGRPGRGAMAAWAVSSTSPTSSTGRIWRPGPPCHRGEARRR